MHKNIKQANREVPFQLAPGSAACYILDLGAVMLNYGSMCDTRLASHRGEGVALLHQDAAGAVVDVFEAVWAQQNAAVPAGDHHHHVPHI